MQAPGTEAAARYGSNGSVAEDEAGRSIFEIVLHVAHGVAAEPDVPDAPEGTTPAGRPRPLPLDLGEALGQAMQVESDPEQPVEGMHLLLQVCEERALCWRTQASPSTVPPPLFFSDGALPSVPTPACSSTAPPPSGPQASSEGSLPSVEALVHFTLCVRMPLLLSTVTVIDGETAEASAETRSTRPRYLLGICTHPTSESVNALQALQLANSVLGASVKPSDPDGTWLLECKDEGDRQALLHNLQMAGCIMNDIGARYRMGELLGVGASSKVFMAQDALSGEEVAVKIVAKRGPDKDLSLLKEATILRWAQHESVLEFFGIYDIQDPATGNGAWAIVSEFVGGGELFEEVRRQGPLTEDRARDVTVQLMSALDFLHHRGIVHRDIKTENVCKTGCADDVKLVDFGLASPEWDDEAMLTRCGSPGYIAPEVLRGERYTCKVDCFSVGVLMFILLTGYGPFRGKTVEEMLHRNLRCKINFRHVAKHSSEAQEMLSKLLVASGDERPSAEQSLASAWIEGPGGLRSERKATRQSTSDGSGHSGEAGAGEQSVPKRSRRRLYSTQLRCADMFKQLKFADTDPDEVAAGPLGGTPDADAGALPNLLEPLPLPTPPAPLPPPWKPSEGIYLPVPAVEGNSFGFGAADLGQDQNYEERVSHVTIANTEPESPGSPGHPMPKRRSVHAMSAESIMTSEPIWAEVQNRVNTLKSQGLLPALVGIASQRDSRKGSYRATYTAARAARKNRACTRPAEQRQIEHTELERKTAYILRDKNRCESLTSQKSEAKSVRTSFFRRDRSRHGSAVGSVDLERPSHADLEERLSHFFMQKSSDCADDESDHGEFLTGAEDGDIFLHRIEDL